MYIKKRGSFGWICLREFAKTRVTCSAMGNTTETASASPYHISISIAMYHLYLYISTPPPPAKSNEYWITLNVYFLEERWREGSMWFQLTFMWCLYYVMFFLLMWSYATGSQLVNILRRTNSRIRLKMSFLLCIQEQKLEPGSVSPKCFFRGSVIPILNRLNISSQFSLPFYHQYLHLV